MQVHHLRPFHQSCSSKIDYNRRISTWELERNNRSTRTMRSNKNRNIDADTESKEGQSNAAAQEIPPTSTEVVPF